MFMQSVRKADPSFTGFVPKSAEEAVDRYVRCRKNGLKPMLIPECLIQCAAGLKGTELDKFESWIINPMMNLNGANLVPSTTINAANDAIFEANCKRIEANMLDALPPLPQEEDEKVQDDEKFDIEMLPMTRQASGEDFSSLAAEAERLRLGLESDSVSPLSEAPCEPHEA